ncbi:hypothetical protein Tco_0949430 [Tanacetum coccineum]
MDLFGLIKNPNPKVKLGTRPRAAHEVPLLQATASRVVTMEETPTISTSTGSAMEKSPLDFTDKDVQMDIVGEHQTDNPMLTTDPQQEHHAAESAATEVPPETNLEQEVLTMGPPVNKRRRKRDMDEAGSSAPSKPDVTQSTKAAAAEDEDTEKSSSFISMGGPPDDIYYPNWCITNCCRLDNLLVCQELVDHIIPPGCFSEIAIEESLIEAESDMKRVAETKNETLIKELEDLHAHFSKLQVDSEQLTHQVATLQAQVTGEEKIKAAFEEFKQFEDKRVEQRRVEMDARLDALSIEFDEELYPHMLTAIAGRRWMIGHGLRLAVMKCAESMELRKAFADVVTAGIAKGLSEGLRDGVEHEKAGLDVASLGGHDPEADEKFTAAHNHITNKQTSRKQLNIPS